jgi:hypothetical protein
MRRLIMRSVAPLAALAMAACSDGGSPSGQDQVNFNAATRPTSSSPTSQDVVSVGSSADAETYTDGVNTLVIARVQLVLREIELHRAGVAAGCGEASDDCAELELGPVMLDLPLGTAAAGAVRRFGVDVATGSYDKVEFKLEKATGSEDAAFVQAHPELADASVRVTGTFNGVTFVFTSDVDADMEFELNPPLSTSAAGAADLTLFVDLRAWFEGNAGLLIDPATALASLENESLVESRITSSLHAFEDEDHDGHEDDGTVDQGSGDN